MSKTSDSYTVISLALRSEDNKYNVTLTKEGQDPITIVANDEEVKSLHIGGTVVLNEDGTFKLAAAKPGKKPKSNSPMSIPLKDI